MLILGRGESLAGLCDDPHTAPCDRVQPAFPTIAPAPSRCPNTTDEPPTTPDVRCKNWYQPRYCVNAPPPLSLYCDFNFTTIQDAINAAPANETIGVGNWFIGGSSPAPTVHSAIVISAVPVCLRAIGPLFWVNTSPDDWRYPIVIRSAPGSSTAVRIDAGGSGSCIQDFKIDHRGSGVGGVQIGTSGAGGAAAHANDVTLVSNQIDLFLSEPNASANTQPGGVLLAGQRNRIFRNVIRGRGLTNAINLSKGVGLFWNSTDPSACADWDGNQINGNSISGFENGIDYRTNSGNGRCHTWTGNLIDRNHILDCTVGIQAVGGPFWPIRVAIRENHIAAGRPYDPARFDLGSLCQPDRMSQGIWIDDVHESDIVGNHIGPVGLGIHLSYDACYTRVEANDVTAVTQVGADPVAIWICPSHCNILKDNALSTNTPASGRGIDFADERSCTPGKPHGTHILDGGMIVEAKCTTRQRTSATITLGALPDRHYTTQIDCQ